MIYQLEYDSFTKLAETSGTIQNCSGYKVEITDEPIFNSGILINEGKSLNFSGTDIYVRCTEEGKKAKIRFVNALL